MVRLFTLQSKPSSDYNKHSMAWVNMRVIKQLQRDYASSGNNV